MRKNIIQLKILIEYENYYHKNAVECRPCMCIHICNKKTAALLMIDRCQKIGRRLLMVIEHKEEIFVLSGLDCKSFYSKND